MESSWKETAPAFGGLRVSKSVSILAFFVLAVALGVSLPAPTYLKYVHFLLIALAGVMGLVLVQRRSILPLCFLIATAVFVPFSVVLNGATRLDSAIPLVSVLLVALIIETHANQQVTITIPPRIVVPLLLFLATASLSLIVGQFPWFSTHGAPLSAQLAGLAIFLLSGAAFLLFAIRLKDRGHIRTITWVFLIAGSVTTLFQVFPVIDDWLAFVLGVASITEPNRIGSMFWTWLIAMAASQAFLNDRLRLASRAGLILLVALVLYNRLITYGGWTSGWLPGVIALGVILLLRFPRLTICLALLALPLVLLSTGIFDSFWHTEGYSFSTRVEAWRVLAEVLSRSLLIGLGPANYYYYTSLFPILGWYVTFSSHNNYVDLIAQTGLIGFVLFWWFMGEMGFLILRVRNRAVPGFDRAFATGVLAGLLASLAACMLGDWLIPFVYNVGLAGFRSSVICWIFLGSLVALARMQRADPPAPVN